MADRPAYLVTPFPIFRERLRLWGSIAKRLGLSNWFVAALRHIDRQLHERPTEWGDPLFTLKAARLQVFQANHEHFLVSYGVHLVQPLVFVRSIDLMNGSPLIGREN